MIGHLVYVTLPGFAIGAVFMALSNRRVPPAAASMRWMKLGVFFMIVHVVLAVAAAGQPWITGFVALVLAAGAVELVRAWRAIPPPRSRRVWPAYVMVGTIALEVSWQLPPEVFAFLFLVTAACDGFAQVVGQLIGTHKLAPRVSPAKTVEGLAGGLVAAVVVALLAHPIIGPTTMPKTLLLAVLTGLAGLVGDLSASWVKRRAGIKDYSNALPGQGGYLDRFDSLLGALALLGPVLVVLGR